MELVANVTRHAEDYLYLLFRVLVGGMFFLHGVQKLMAGMEGLMLVVGIFETLIGLAVVFGLFTRLAALGGFIIVFWAYVSVHFPQAWSPLENKGELALLYLAAYLVLMVWGARKFQLEKLLFGKELV